MIADKQITGIEAVAGGGRTKRCARRLIGCGARHYLQPPTISGHCVHAHCAPASALFHLAALFALAAARHHQRAL